MRRSCESPSRSPHDGYGGRVSDIFLELSACALPLTPGRGVMFSLVACPLVLLEESAAGGEFSGESPDSTKVYGGRVHLCCMRA